MPSTRRRCRCSRETFQSGAPEVEALIRITNAGLRLEEVPVTMEERASGESKLRGSKAVKLVVTVTATLLAARLLRAAAALERLVEAFAALVALGALAVVLLGIEPGSLIERRISPPLGSSARSTCFSGFQRSERMRAFEHWV